MKSEPPALVTLLTELLTLLSKFSQRRIYEIVVFVAANIRIDTEESNLDPFLETEMCKKFVSRNICVGSDFSANTIVFTLAYLEVQSNPDIAPPLHNAHDCQ